MESLKELYRIGRGPSSSHTMGPAIAAKKFLEKHKDCNAFKVTLYGSLALTGKGHLLDKVLEETFVGYQFELIYNYEVVYQYHPNGMKFEAFLNNERIDRWLVFSVGGGQLKELNEDRSVSLDNVYTLKNMKEIISYCKNNNLSLVDYVISCESNIKEYINLVLKTMFDACERGLNQEGVLPGGLNVTRRAQSFYQKYLNNKSFSVLAFAASLACAEENASAGIVVTAPTCGSCGVIPGLLYASKYYNNVSDEKLVEALMVAGLIGNVCKTNGSISGAEVGCQGEIGVASSMAAGMMCFLNGGTIDQIEYAAEIALEHHLGMTCDPIDGLVQIPCIERNAIAQATANSAAEYAIISDGKHKISLDHVIDVMVKTGKDLSDDYRETSLGGLAKKRIGE